MPTSVSGLAFAVSQSELAKMIGLSTRQVRNLEAAGMPVAAEGGKKRYPLPDALHWWRDRAIERALEPFETTALQEERRRLVAAQADKAEMELAQSRRELVTVAAFDEVLAQVLDTLRRTIFNFGGSYPPRLANRDIREVSRVIREEMTPELLAALRAGDEVAHTKAGDE